MQGKEWGRVFRRQRARGVGRGKKGGGEGEETDIGVDEALVLGLVVNVDGHGAEGGDFGGEG